MSEEIKDFMIDHLLAILIVIVVLIVFCGLHIASNFGEKTYIGYVYSVTTEWAGHVTVGHLRFSESAGGDIQPSFCVANEDADELRELAGSGKKVKVTIPHTGFVWGEAFKCKIPAKVEVKNDNA